MYHEVTDREAMGYMATKPTMIITTFHESGIVNAGVFGAYTNLGPTQLGVAIGAGSHTYANIKRSGEFVINIPGADIVETIRILASDVPAERSELEEAALTAKPGITIDTPSIAECVAAVEFLYSTELPIGHHNFVVGEVQGGWIREDCRDDDGKLNIFKARIFKDFKYPKPLYVLPGEVVEG